MVDVIAAIAACGGVASYRALDALGVARFDVRSAVRAGLISSVRPRWFASPVAPPEVVSAVQVGGTLTGASVARLRGLWTMNDDLLHVRVASTASRLAAPHDRTLRLDAAEHRVCVHYSPKSGTDRGCDPVLAALAEMFGCGDARSAIVAVDSALNKRLLRRWELPDLRARLSADKRRLVDRVDGGAQSGLETLVRLLLLSRRIPFTTQAYVSGVGRVDVLVGDRLVLELDGAEFHTGDQFEEDRRRDLGLVKQGYAVVRLSYRQVMGQWDDVTPVILDLVRRGEHRWGYRVRPVAG